MILKKNCMIIGFYFRAVRVRSPHYLDEELKYIENAFKLLRYFMLTAKSKLWICAWTGNGKNGYREEPRYLSLSTNTSTQIIADKPKEFEIKTTQNHIFYHKKY